MSFDEDDWDDDEDQDSAFGSSFSASILVHQDYRLPVVQEQEQVTPSTPTKSDRYEHPIKTTAAPSSPALSWTKSPIKQLLEPSLEEEIMDMDTSSSSDLSVGEMTANRLVLRELQLQSGDALRNNNNDLLMHRDAASGATARSRSSNE
jgi:hypothetical protein